MSRTRRGASIERTTLPPRTPAPAPARMAIAAARVIDDTPVEAIAGETIEAFELLAESVQAALRDSRRQARLVEQIEPAAMCTWVAWCTQPATHEAACTTRPGLLVSELVCDEHRSHAERQGFRLIETADL